MTISLVVTCLDRTGETKIIPLGSPHFEMGWRPDLLSTIAMLTQRRLQPPGVVLDPVV